jgi:hypothetical protein
MGGVRGQKCAFLRITGGARAAGGGRLWSALPEIVGQARTRFGLVSVGAQDASRARAKKGSLSFQELDEIAQQWLPGG